MDSNSLSVLTGHSQEHVTVFYFIHNRYFGLTIGFYAIFVGIIGNALTILIYISNKKLRTTFNTLLLNLAIVDFITASLMLPFNVAGYVQLKW